MLKVGQPRPPRGAEEVLDGGLLPFASEEVDQSFCGLLEDEELEEVFAEFRVNVASPD